MTAEEEHEYVAGRFTLSCLNRLKMKMSTWDKLCCFFAEILGTGLLMFLGCMGCISNSVFKNSPVQMSFNFGLVVLSIIQIFGCVSGAHLNPAVTFAAWIYDAISLPMAAVYVVAQMIGAFIGYGLLMVLVPASAIFTAGDAHAACITQVQEELTVVQGLFIEFMLTSVLILVCCAVWDPRNQGTPDSTPLRFGLIVSMLSVTGGPFTGASMNPARTFAPAVWNNDFRDNWIYWVGPLAAAGVTAITYKTVFRREMAVELPKNSKEQRASRVEVLLS